MAHPCKWSLLHQRFESGKSSTFVSSSTDKYIMEVTGNTTVDNRVIVLQQIKKKKIIKIKNSKPHNRHSDKII